MARSGDKWACHVYRPNLKVLAQDRPIKKKKRPAFIGVGVFLHGFGRHMDLLAPTSTHACILATCTDPCFHAGEHQNERVHVRVSEAKPSKSTFGTWLASSAELIAVSKFGNLTFVYLPAHDTFYFASPAMLLSTAIPDKTVLLGQFIIDNEKTPRVLFFDVAKLHGVAMRDVPASDRYECLQKLQAGFGQMCALQWAGDCESLFQELKTGRFEVPHAVKGVIALTVTPGHVVFSAFG